jgi:ATP-dependent Clp protease ATP-binding subunit ClpA
MIWPDQQLLGTTGSGQQLGSRLHSKTIGQDEATEQIVSVCQTLLAAMDSPARPAGNFLILAPTGAGKIRVVEATAERPGGAGASINIDYIELQNRHQIANLIGSLERITERPDPCCVSPAATECDLDSELTPWLRDGHLILDR